MAGRPGHRADSDAQMHGPRCCRTGPVHLAGTHAARGPRPSQGPRVPMGSRGPPEARRTPAGSESANGPDRGPGGARARREALVAGSLVAMLA